MLILWGFPENTLLFFFLMVGGGGGGGRVLGKKEGGRGGWYPNEHYGVNTKWKVGVWVYFWHFCVYCIVLNGPANACLNNNVLKFQLYQSVSPSFRLSVTLVSYFFGQSVCQMLCSKYHCLVFVGPFLYYCSFYRKN